MTDLTRRSIMKALTAVAGIGTQAGAAIAGAAVKAASSAPATPASFMNTPMTASSTLGQLSEPARAALTILENRTYRSPPANLDPVRASITCFRSASPVNKVRWEQAAADADALQRSVYETAMCLIREGKVPLL